jgi:hypothetical protein
MSYCLFFGVALLALLAQCSSEGSSGPIGVADSSPPGDAKTADALEGDDRERGDREPTDALRDGDASIADDNAERPQGDGGADASLTPIGANSVLERNNHASRDGHFAQPLLTRAAGARMARDAAFQPMFNGNSFASPLYVENGPGGRGIFIVVTSSADVMAFDEDAGNLVWKTSIGNPAFMTGVGCGDTNPLGILSTPVIDGQARTIYVAGAIGTQIIDRHEVHALSIDDGTERAGWPVNVATIGSGNIQFTAPPQNQRSALSLVQGVLYVAYGGHNGDCNSYHGWVVGIDTRDPTRRGAWATTGARSGIWAAGGLASDGNGVFAVTGNGVDATHADSEEVVHITGLGFFDRTNQNFYYPSRWQEMDTADADFGAINPVYVTIPNATPSNYVVALSKDGHMYLLDSANLGGMDGHTVDFMVSNGGTMAIHTVPTAYTTAQGVHVAFAVESGALCPAPSPTGMVVMSVLIPPGSPPAPRVQWCASLGGVVTSPITTTTDGRSDAIVWYMNNATLNGVDGDTGQTIYSGADTCVVRKWTSPIAVKGRIVVAGDNVVGLGHMCSWSPR